VTLSGVVVMPFSGSVAVDRLIACGVAGVGDRAADGVLRCVVRLLASSVKRIVPDRAAAELPNGRRDQKLARRAARVGSVSALIRL
jgi:hypothetical protein